MVLAVAAANLLDGCFSGTLALPHRQPLSLYPRGMTDGAKNEIATTLSVASELEPTLRPDELDLTRIARAIARREAARRGERDAWLARLRWAMEDDAARARSHAPPAASSTAASEAIAEALHKAANGAGHTIGARLDRFAVEHARRTAMEAYLGAELFAWSKAWLLARLAALHGGASPAAIDIVSERLSIWSRALAMSAGPQREALLTSLGKINDGRRFANPCRPVRAGVTAAPQRELRDPATGLRVRLVGEPAQSTRPPLVLIHGHGSSMEEYDALRAALASRLTDVPVLGIDLPGCGYAEVTGGSYVVEPYAPLIVAAMKAAGYPQFVAAGGSMGGNLALQLARMGPSAGVVAAIPWSPVAWGELTGELVALGLLAQTMAGLDGWEGGFWATYHVQKGTWYHPDWPGRAAALAGSDLYREEVYSRDYHRAYFGLAADQSLSSHRHEAEHIEVPVLLMAGVNDEGPYQVHSSAVALHQRIAGSDFFDAFTYGGHSIASEDAELLADQIAGFFHDRIP